MQSSPNEDQAEVENAIQTRHERWRDEVPPESTGADEHALQSLDYRTFGYRRPLASRDMLRLQHGLAIFQPSHRHQDRSPCLRWRSNGTNGPRLQMAREAHP